ncbi:MAG: Na+/proline symporter [Candidatus Peregrinibacteria bacterium Greene0416_62]|nr:MAG: Na+/proline symporter [Candidatus Peregrinibacteria bacterium Greene0416_62]TSD00762.1 MAG: Na+/proline symporter [Candidatus Peregrinibacteria bacterium Greene1014_49]
MNFVSPAIGYWFLFGFAIVITLFTYFFARRSGWQTKEGFLLANRKVGWVLGGFSIASSWIWAPALFVSVQVAYQKGLAGIFWFTLPNILALLIFAVFAPKIRARFPEGYTFTQFIRYRLQSDRVHKIFLFPYIFYQLMAVVVQLFAGGSLLSLLTGIPLTTIMPILALIVLIYTSISGFQASIVTDFVQLGLIYVVGLIILPLAWHAAGGASAVSAGFHGVQNIQSMLDPGVAFSFGIVTSIGLIAGSISDQSNWQRAFAIQDGQVVRAFIFGSVLFGLVPIGLSTLGFLGANPALGITLPEGVDPSMIGVQTVASLLPFWAVSLFVVMLLAGLSSALDAGLSAASSLWVTDVVHPKDDAAAVKSARRSMVAMTVIGLLVSLAAVYVPNFGLQQLWWVFNTIAACVMVPTVLSLYWDRLDERGVFWGVLVAFFVGIPLFVYSNLIDNPVWIVGSTLFVVGVTLAFCLAFPKKVVRA